MEAAGILSVTFGLGYILQSALTGLNGLNPKGSYRDRYSKTPEEQRVLCTPRRLGLFIFFISVVVWSTLFFTIFMLTSDLACNISIVFVAIFDQLSRISVIGVGLWGVRGQIDDKAERGTLIVFILLRFLLGIAVTAFTRSTFMPVCFPEATTTVHHGRMAGIAQLAFDGVMLTVMLVRAWAAWSACKKRDEDSSKGAGLVMIVISMKVWNLALLPYILKLGSVFVRLSPIIISLAILLALIRAYPDIFWFLLFSDAEVSSSTGHMRPGSEPPMGPGGPGMSYRDPESNHMTRSNVTQSGSGSGRHRSANSSLFRSIIGLPAPAHNTAWGMRSEQGTLKRQTRFSGAPSNALMSAQSMYIETKHPPHAGGMSKISGPILKNGGFGPADDISGGDNVEPFAGMRTVSLRTAAETEWARVDEQFEEEEESRRKGMLKRQSTVQTPRTIASFAGLPSHLNQQRRATLQKANASILRGNTMRSQQSAAEGRIVSSEDMISPRGQRGYRMSNTTFSTEDDTVKQMFSNADTYALTAPPRAMPRNSMVSSDRRVLLLNNIKYDDPVLVNSIIEEQKQRHSRSLSTGFAQPPNNGALRRSPLTVHAEQKETHPTTPVMERKRGAGLKRTESRKLFPRESGLSPEMLDSIYGEKLPSPPPPPTEPLPAPPVPKSLSLHKRSTSSSSKGGVRLEYAPPPPMPAALTNQGLMNRDSSATADPYEMAKAWVASAVPVQQKFAHPELVDVSLSRENSMKRRESQATYHTRSGYGSEGIRQTSLTMSVITSSELTGSTVLADDDDEEDTGVIPVFIPKSEQAFSERDSDDEGSDAGSSMTKAQSLHTPNYRESFEEINISPYVPSPPANAEDYYTSHLSVPSDISYNGYLSDDNEYGYSDLEDSMEEMQSLQLSLHHNIQDLTRNFTRAVTPPKPKKLGDTIPTFLTRGPEAYGQKRKQPPMELGRVPLRSQYQQQQQQVAPAPPPKAPTPPPPKAPTPPPPVTRSVNPGIAARLTMLIGAVQKPEALEENIIRHLPGRLLSAPSNDDRRNSNISSGRNSLLRQLESEAIQQESQWSGLRKSMRHDSLASFLSTPDSLPANRRSLLERVHKGIECRMSRQEAEVKIVHASDEDEDASSPKPLPSRAMVTSKFYMHDNMALSNASLVSSLAETLENSEPSSADDEKPNLWTQPSEQPPTVATGGHLWTGRAIGLTAPPAAIDVRPKKRFDNSVLAISSFRLWSPPKVTVNLSRNSQLWAGTPRSKMPRSILSIRQRASSTKRVTFREDVMAVDTSTGVKGHYKKLVWGLPVPKPAVRTINETPISAILDTIAKKYERKAFPQLPTPDSSQPTTPSTPRKRPASRPLGLATMATGSSAADNRPKSFIAPSVPPKRHSRSKSKDLRIDLEVIRQSELLEVGSMGTATPSLFDATPVVASAKVGQRVRASLVGGPTTVAVRKNDDAEKASNRDRKVEGLEEVVRPIPSRSAVMISTVREDQQQRPGHEETEARDISSLQAVPAVQVIAWWEDTSSRHKLPASRGNDEQAESRSELLKSDVCSQPVAAFPTRPAASASASDEASNITNTHSDIIPDHNSYLWKTSPTTVSASPYPKRPNMLSTAPPQLWSKTLVHSQPPTTVPDLFKKSPAPAPRAKQYPKPDPPRATGSLWTKPSTESSPPKELWKPTASKGLWTQDGETVALADLAAARREVAELWKKGRDEPTLFKKTNEEVVCVTSRNERETNEIVSSQEEAVRKQTTLWVPPAPPPRSKTPGPTWTKGANGPDLFSHIPTGSLTRFKKEISTQTLPVFSEDLWKATVPLPPQPTLWTPSPKPSLLWSSRTGAPVASLPHLAADLKRSSKLLWTRRTASRTTTALPPQHTRTPFIPPTTPLPVVSGSLWKRSSPTAPTGLWKRNVRRKTVASETIPPRSPLWAKHTARRTTMSMPERGENAKKPADIRALPVFSGPMWTKPSETTDKDKLWAAERAGKTETPRLWSQAPERHSAIPKPERIPPAEEAIVSLWTPPSSSEPRRASLWTPPAAAPATDDAPKSPLWAPHTARRYTDSKPTRGTPQARKPSDAVLKKAEGGLWGEQQWGLSRASTFESAVESDEEKEQEQEQEEIPVRVRGSISSVEEEVKASGGFGGLWAKMKGAAG